MAIRREQGLLLGVLVLGVLVYGGLQPERSFTPVPGPSKDYQGGEVLLCS